jgi:hypothetical protein
MAEERRGFSRRKTVKGGQITFHHGNSTIESAIRNMSDGGAKLEVESTNGIPDDFDLTFSDGRPTKACRVRWRRGTSLGVEFVETM